MADLEDCFKNFLDEISIKNVLSLAAELTEGNPGYVPEQFVGGTF